MKQGNLLVLICCMLQLGLKRTGKSCRLRWLNYLKPDIKRGNLTPEEQLLILELHSKWGNRWSRIAQHLPGRTDNEIKNYWRTHFKKGKPSKNIERARARFLKQRQEMMQQQQQSLGQLDEDGDQRRGMCCTGATADDDEEHQESRQMTSIATKDDT